MQGALSPDQCRYGPEARLVQEAASQRAPGPAPAQQHHPQVTQTQDCPQAHLPGAGATAGPGGAPQRRPHPPGPALKRAPGALQPPGILGTRAGALPHACVT